MTRTGNYGGARAAREEARQRAFETRRAIVEAFKRAAAAATEAGKNEEDGGTSNLDTPAFRIEGMRSTDVLEIAKEAGLTAAPFTWFAGKKWYWLNVPLLGQGNRRSRMTHAAHLELKKLVGVVPGFKACEYLQID